MGGWVGKEVGVDPAEANDRRVVQLQESSERSRGAEAKDRTAVLSGEKYNVRFLRRHARWPASAAVRTPGISSAPVWLRCIPARPVIGADPRDPGRRRSRLDMLR